MILSETSREWAQRITEPLPLNWQSRLISNWESTKANHQTGDFFAQVKAERTANIELRELLDRLGVVRVPLDATDGHICDEANKATERAMQLASVYHQVADLREALGRMASSYGITPPDHKKHQDAPAIARMTCPMWWRRQLRRVHGQQVETAAIFLGYVNKRSECYASDNTVKRRAAQNRRNAASLEATTATNENGQEFTLAELAAKGTANKAIRRAELMTRIAGFERIAKDMGHAGLFLTITCPSRMHRYTTAGSGQPVRNRKFDGTTPREANKYLVQVWARIRASLARQGVSLYGFRIAEPQHDGTPHWHLLVFHAQEKYEAISATVWKQALQDSGTERGATERRCDFKPIDPTKGSAAGYIAKYVSKNIDGYAIEKDLTGEDAITASARVEAWASTWGIRQFQQVGGPPVGPWRELRRVAAMPAGAPAHLADAYQAAQRVEATDTEELKAAAWDKYVQAQGGVFCGRDYLVRVTLQESDQVGRYGDQVAPKPIGVETEARETWYPEWMQHIQGTATRVVHWFVESVRHVWTIARNAARGLDVLPRAIGTPWTRVNNCTPPIEMISAELAAAEAEAAKVNRITWSGNHDGRTKTATSAPNDTNPGRRGGSEVGQSANAHQGHGGGVRGAGHCGSAGRERRIAGSVSGRIPDLIQTVA